MIYLFLVQSATAPALTGELACPLLLLGDMGLPRPDPEWTESDDSEEFDVERCFLAASTSSGLFRLLLVSGWGTKITDTQLSSESIEVSL